eukprot:s4304_g3.t3
MARAPSRSSGPESKATVAKAEAAAAHLPASLMLEESGLPVDAALADSWAPMRLLVRPGSSYLDLAPSKSDHAHGRALPFETRAQIYSAICKLPDLAPLHTLLGVRRGIPAPPDAIRRCRGRNQRSHPRLQDSHRGRAPWLLRPPARRAAKYLRREGRLPNDQVRFYSGEILLAFGYLHSLHVVYRDLKPENALLDFEGHIKLTDFGFAKVVEERTWTLCGTPEYLAPEMIQSKGHGKGVDWWALGVLLCEMLAGYPPFYDENPYGIYQKVLKGHVDFPRHFDVKAKDLIQRLLQQDRSKRLGCLKAGVEDVKKHKWYKGMDWDLLLTRSVTPPFRPPVQSEDDTSMFDRYPESTEASAPAISAKEQESFQEFDTSILGA